MPDPPASQPHSPVEPDLSGRQFGDYQVLRRLGQGAMAEVYLALQRSLGRQVALKVLRRSLASDESYVHRFHNEARAAASLVHANIVQIHEVGRIDGTHFIVQEYVRGQNLGQYLKRNGPLSVPLGLTIMRQACGALQRASEEGIVHRDIKPENIMLSTKGEVKVADFGLARTQDADVNLTQVGVTMGTPLYMSPEQVQGQPLDSRSDLYSLGVTFFHMLTGALPFEGDSPLNVAIQHVQNEPPELASIRHDLPAKLCQVIHRMLAKAAEDRFQSPNELLHELQLLQSETKNVEWPVESDLLASSDCSALGTARMGATQRLEKAMRQSATMRDQGKRRPWAKPLIGLACVAAFVVGALIALSLRQPDLLELTPGEQRELVGRRESAQSQLDLARALRTESGYRSVRQFFPNDKHQIRLAEIALARLYLEPASFDPDRALLIFQKMASLDESYRQFRAAGLAGEAVVYYLHGNFQESQLRLAALQVHDLVDELEPDVQQELHRIGSKNEEVIQKTSR